MARYSKNLPYELASHISVITGKKFMVIHHEQGWCLTLEGRRYVGHFHKTLTAFVDSLYMLISFYAALQDKGE